MISKSEGEAIREDERKRLAKQLMDAAKNYTQYATIRAFLRQELKLDN